MAKTNTGLITYCKAQLGKPYWYGCYGQKSTKELYNSKKKQYPNQYQWACKDNQPNTDPAKQLGVKVHDCIGLIKGYLWSKSATDTSPDYKDSQDVSANGMLEKCTRKGTISTMPDVLGLLVFLPGHVGVYIGDGWVIEAKGHKYGVVKTKLKGRGWKHWAYCPWITYEDTAKTPKTNDKSKTKKSIDKIAKEVIDGKWGVGDERKKKLKAAGYDYNTVQKRVNEMLKSKKKSVTEIAKEVIEGKWGNGLVRIAKLKVAGYDYKVVQKEVNKLLK